MVKNYESNLRKKKKKNIIYLISGILALVSIGTITYLVWPKKAPQTETKKLTSVRIVHQLQTHLTSQKSQLSKLKTTAQSQTALLADKSYTDTLTPTKLAELQQALNTNKQKVFQLETRINNLEKQLKNLASQPNLEQTKLIQQLEQESKAISNSLGIPFPPLPKPDTPTPPEEPNPQPSPTPPPENPTPQPPQSPPPTPPNNNPLAQTKKEALEKIDNPTAEEKQKINQADSSPKVMKELSGILRERILSDISEWCIFFADDRGVIIDADTMGLIVYEKGIFEESDYRQIRQAFIQEIIDNPSQWKLERKIVKTDIGGGNPFNINIKSRKKFTFTSGARVHDERGMELTAAEWKKILESIYKKLVYNQTFITGRGERFYVWDHEGGSQHFLIQEGNSAFDKFPGGMEIFFKERENPSKVEDGGKRQIYKKTKRIFVCWIGTMEGKVKPVGNFDEG